MLVTIIQAVLTNQMKGGLDSQELSTQDDSKN